MAALKIGDKFPEGVVFSYVPYTEEKEDITACGIPINYDASKEWANKKVVLFAVPGAFTPGCSARHLPAFIQNLPAIKSKNVDVVAVIAFNDAFVSQPALLLPLSPYQIHEETRANNLRQVMSAWAKANKVKNDDIMFLSDVETKFSKSIGWTVGDRTARYAMIMDHGKVVYAERETKPGDVTVSGAEAVMAKL
ncbi:hypothetical protein MMC10_009251 [Thelotrema lepadinum]|nr:hypothetical protein [Thelotrema lepadinum]